MISAALGIVLACTVAAGQAQTAVRVPVACGGTGNTIADIIERAAPYVVNITTNTVVVHNEPVKDKTEAARRFRRYWGTDTVPSEESQRVSGSGIIIRSNGIILTSLHVVENAESITVTLKDGKALDGKLLARDPFSDLALVKVSCEALPQAVFADSSHLRLGDWVIAIGNQFGLGHTATQGIVSGLGREAKGFEKSFGARTGQLRFIQTDAPINPGSSGGPLINLQGEVIGVNTFIREDAQNIAFAVPSNIAKSVSDKLLAGLTPMHPYIGIVMKETAPVPTSPGVEITEVQAGSPAARAGLTPGDLVLALDEKPVFTSDDISLTVAKHNVGDNIKFKLRRNGSDREITVRVENLPVQGS